MGVVIAGHMLNRAPSSNRGLRVVVALALASALVGPAAGAGSFVGSSGAEAYGHLWVQAWVTDAWPVWPTGTAMANGASAWPVIDPLPTWFAGGLARALTALGMDGPRGAWNAYAFLGVFIASLGGASLAEAAGGRWEVGAVGIGAAPIFVGSLASGLSEDWMVGLVAFAIANALRSRWLRAGAILGITAWCGLYLAWLGAAALVGIAIYRWADWRRWLAGGLIAAALGSGAAWPFRARLAGEGHRSGNFTPRAEPLWRISPWKSSDLAAFVTPGKVDTAGAVVREHPTYLGWTTIGLGVAAVVPPSVPVVLAAAGLAATISVAAGETVSIAGTPTRAENPIATLFRQLPLAGRFNHLGRTMLLGQMVLVAIAARGARRFRPGAAAILILAETTFLSPARVPLPGTPGTAPDIYLALATLPPAPVLVIGERHPQKPFFDQRFHGRRIMMNPNGGPPGRAAPGTIIVAFGDAIPALTAERGTPTVTTSDGAAWLVESAN